MEEKELSEEISAKIASLSKLSREHGFKNAFSLLLVLQREGLIGARTMEDFKNLAKKGERNANAESPAWDRKDLEAADSILKTASTAVLRLKKGRPVLRFKGRDEK